jgi:hypothetical protein
MSTRRSEACLKDEGRNLRPSLLIVALIFVQCSGRTMSSDGSADAATPEAVADDAADEPGRSEATADQVACSPTNENGYAICPIHNPCGGKSCAEPCQQCSTPDASCYPGYCDALGSCKAGVPDCTPGAPRSCAPTDAKGVNDPGGRSCRSVFGWGWDGSHCNAVVGCYCQGSECGVLLNDEFTCEGEYAHCMSD